MHRGASVAAVPPAANSALEGSPKLIAEGLACLRRLGPRCVWWKTSDEAMQFPDRVAAQVMDLGTWDDLTAKIDAVGEDYLRGVLRHAEAGQL
jgi:hypothetical protein